jgi:hypothetical protein
MIIGLFFFLEKTVTDSSYLDMPQLYAFPQLEHRQSNVFFQQAGAPPHGSLDLQRALNATLPGRWIGRDDPTDWPPSAPDITPLDFFLWGYVMDRIYATKVQDLGHLQARIVEPVSIFTPDMLQRTWAALDCRLDILRVTNGAHVQVY